MKHKLSEASRDNIWQQVGGRCQNALGASVDAASLAVFRIAFGAVMFWEMCRFWYYDWMASDYLALSFRFTYLGFDWVRPWPEPGVHVQLAVMTIAALGITLGMGSRLSAFIFGIGYSHIFLLEPTYYQNHCYLICLLSFLLAVVPSQRAFSVDAWFKRLWKGTGGESTHTAQPLSGTSPVIPAWPVWLLRFQVGVPYFYGGLAKLEGDWLHGAQSRMMFERSAADWPALAGVLAHPATVGLFVWGGLLFDLLIVPCLLWRRTRLLAYLLAVLFHLANAALLEIGIFPWLMIGATTIYFAPDWPRQVFRRLPSPSSRKDRTKADSVAHGAVNPPGRLARIALTLYVLWQVLFPFRLLLYPGNASWTEEGHRFAWRMKLGFKTAMLPRFFAVDPATGEVHPLAYEGNLTLRQLELMAGHPDMLLEFSHFLADELQQRGFGRMEIRVVTAVSLNGRRPQTLIDPEVDLAAQPRTLKTKPWVVPLMQPRRQVPWDWGSPPIQ